MSQLFFFSFVTIRVFEFCHILSCHYLSFVTILIFKFCHKLSIWVLSKFEFEFCHNLSFWVLSPFEPLSFITIWVFEFCHNLSFQVLSSFEFSSLVTIWVFELSQLDCFSFVAIWFFELSQGKQDAAELAANTYANHFCTKYFWIFFLQIIFFSMLMKEDVFVSRNFLLLHKLKKKDDLTSASYLNM